MEARTLRSQFMNAEMDITGRPALFTSAHSETIVARKQMGLPVVEGVAPETRRPGMMNTIRQAIMQVASDCPELAAELLAGMNFPVQSKE